jgi:dipeptidyl aminopeptidase/acylaminoacyl peptidase
VSFSNWRAVGAVLSMFLGALLVLAAPQANAAAPDKSLITMDDMLHAEGIGEAAFSPDGRSFAFVRRVPIASQDSWSYESAEVVRARVFVSPTQRPLPREIPNTADVRYALVPFLRPEKVWSPDNRGLLLLASTRQGYSLAYADAVTGEVSALPGSRIGLGAAFDWVKGGRAVYAALSKDVPQPGMGGGMLSSLQAQWHASWYSHDSQATVSSADPVFTTSEPPQGTLLLGDVHGRTSQELAKGNYVVVSVSPNGHYLAALREAETIPHPFGFRGKRGELQVFELTAAGGRMVYRAPDLDVAVGGVRPYDSLAWSPSGKRLLVMGKYAQGGARESHLYVFDLNAAKRQELSANGLSFINPGASTADRVLQIGWLGEQPIAVAVHPNTRAGLATQKSSAPLPWDQLDYGESRNLRYDIYALSGAKPDNLTAFSKTSVNEFLTPPGSDALWVVAGEALWRLVPGKPAQRLSPDGGPSLISFDSERSGSPLPSTCPRHSRGDADECVAVYVLVDGKPRREVLSLESGKLTPLESRGEILATAPDWATTLSKSQDGWTTTLSLNSEGVELPLVTVNDALKDKAVAAFESFEYQYRGRPLRGWVVLPPGAKADARLPAVVYVYGGTVFGQLTPADVEPQTTEFPVFSAQLLAAQGYAVVLPSTPLESGASSDVMAILAGETVAAIDALSTAGMIDPRRVGVIGQSFGGYSTAAILAKRSDRFRAGIAMAGVYDWVYAYGIRALEQTLTNDGNIVAAETTMVETGQIGLQKPFWDSPQAYMRNSPIFHVESIDAPLLLLHGDFDMGITGVPDAERMYNALLRAGKKPALVRYWGEGHVAQSAWAMRDQWERITAWFGHYLGAGTRSRPQAVEAPQRR